jgi:hypothetical protein
MKPARAGMNSALAFHPTIIKEQGRLRIFPGMGFDWTALHCRDIKIFNKGSGIFLVV